MRFSDILTVAIARRMIQLPTRVLACGLALTAAAAAQTSTLTYHNDPQRTGWNAAEHSLTPANVRPGSFEFYTSVVLDDQVDTQPLVANGVSINGQVREVAYVATEGNTVYAIAPGFGGIPRTPASILKQKNLGPPVHMPLGCGNNGPNVGIDGTPVINLGTQTMYVVAYTIKNGKPTYQLHALDLGTLNDKPGSPITVAASHTLTDGSVYNFNASVQRQRPGLLLANGNVYAAFGSFCDFNSGSRGWLLGWNSATLAPLAAKELTDTLTSAGGAGCPQAPCFLSSIWMSGYGVAAETPGDIFFVTGNSGGSYTGTTSIQESVVKVSPSLAAVHHVFTPTNFSALDQHDVDFGSGGVMVVPDQPGPLPRLAVAAGKDGRLFILNRSNLGGVSTPQNVNIGACWCGPSYYKGSDGVGRVVSSGGVQAKTWKINTAASPALQFEASAPALVQSQDGGFFTSISSNGIVAKTAVIWAVARPSGTDHHITLSAFDGTASGGALKLLWSRAAGTWPNLSGNANVVPTVANSRVYVASYQRLFIASLTGRAPNPIGNESATAGLLEAPPAPPQMQISGAAYWGTIKSVQGSRVTIGLRTGKTIEADLSEAVKSGTTVNPAVGLNVFINGAAGAQGVVAVKTMWRAKAPDSWGIDRAQ